MSEGLYNTAGKGAVYNYASTLFVTLLQFFMSIILVRFLSVSDYGIYNIIIGSIGFLGLVFPFATIMRFLPQYFQEGNYYLGKKLVRIFISYSLIALLVFLAGVFFLSVSPFSQYLSGLGIKPEFLWFFGFISFFTVFSGIFDVVLVALLDQKFRSITRVVYSAIILLAAFFLIKSFAILGVFTAILLSTILLFACIAFRAKRLVFSKPDSGSRNWDSKNLLKYSFFSSFNYFGDIVLSLTVDIWVVWVFLGSYSAGLYAFAAKTAQYLILLSPVAVTNVVIFPMIVKKFSETKSKPQLSYFFRLYNKFVFFFVLPMIAGMVLLSAPIIRFVFNPEYLVVTGLFAIATVGFIFTVLRIPVYSVYNTLEKPEIGFKAKFFFVYNLVADIILIPLYGLNGAIFATTSATFFVFLTEYLLTRKLIELHFPKLAILKMLANSAVLAVFLLAVLPLVKGLFTLAISILAGAIVYFAVSFLNKPFSARDSGFFRKISIVGKFFSHFAGNR